MLHLRSFMIILIHVCYVPIFGFSTRAPQKNIHKIEQTLADVLDSNKKRMRSSFWGSPLSSPIVSQSKMIFASNCPTWDMSKREFKEMPPFQKSNGLRTLIPPFGFGESSEMDLEVEVKVAFFSAESSWENCVGCSVLMKGIVGILFPFLRLSQGCKLFRRD